MINISYSLKEEIERRENSPTTYEKLKVKEFTDIVPSYPTVG